MTQIYTGLQEKLPCCGHLFSHVSVFCSLVTNFWPVTVGDVKWQCGTDEPCSIDVS